MLSKPQPRDEGSRRHARCITARRQSRRLEPVIKLVYAEPRERLLARRCKVKSAGYTSLHIYSQARCIRQPLLLTVVEPARVHCGSLAVANVNSPGGRGNVISVLTPDRQVVRHEIAEFGIRGRRGCPDPRPPTASPEYDYCHANHQRHRGQQVEEAAFHLGCVAGLMLRIGVRISVTSFEA